MKTEAALKSPPLSSSAAPGGNISDGDKIIRVSKNADDLFRVQGYGHDVQSRTVTGGLWRLATLIRADEK